MEAIHQKPLLGELLRLGNAVRELEEPSIREVSEKLNDHRRDHLSHIFMIGSNLGLFVAETRGRAQIHRVTEAFNILNKIYADKLVEVADEIAQLREQITDSQKDALQDKILIDGLWLTVTKEGKVTTMHGITRVDTLDKLFLMERAFSVARVFEKEPLRKRWYEYIEHRLIQARRLLTMRISVSPEAISAPSKEIGKATVECLHEARKLAKETHIMRESVSELIVEAPIALLIRAKEDVPCILISGDPLAEVEDELRKEAAFRENLKKTLGVSPEEVFADFEVIRTLPGGWIERRWKPRQRSRSLKES